MKALVLTCNKYKPFADHMQITYDRCWPNHPFDFYMPSFDPIKEAVDDLLKYVEDDEWFYWCIDDKYIIDLDLDFANKVYEWVKSIDDSKISGIIFSRSGNFTKSRNLYEDQIIDGPSKFIRRKNYALIWLHQFLRGKVLKEMFSQFPSFIERPKDMDIYKRDLVLPDSHRLYVSEGNHVVFGESTTRGKITQNCIKSFKKYNIKVPEDFDISNKKITIGAPLTT